MSEQTPPSQASHTDSVKERSERKARRLLLKALVYAPPMILGSMIVNPQLIQAGAQVDPPGTICPGGATVSCAPIGCCPCIANPLSKNCGDSTAQACQDSNFTCGPCSCAPCMNNGECVRDVCKDQLNQNPPVVCAPCECTPCQTSQRCTQKSCSEQIEQAGIVCAPCGWNTCTTDPKCLQKYCKETLQQGWAACAPCSCAPCFCGPNNDGANTCAPDGDCAPTGDVRGKCD